MSARTYTEHALTDPMLQRLSKWRKIADESREPNAKDGALFGNSCMALMARGLLDEGPSINDAGREALANARMEGW